MWRILADGGDERPRLQEDADLRRFVAAAFAGGAVGAAAGALTSVVTGWGNPGLVALALGTAHLGAHLTVLPFACLLPDHPSVATRAERVLVWSLLVVATPLVFWPDRLPSLAVPADPAAGVGRAADPGAGGARAAGARARRHDRPHHPRPRAVRLGAGRARAHCRCARRAARGVRRHLRADRAAADAARRRAGGDRPGGARRAQPAAQRRRRHAGRRHHRHRRAGPGHAVQPRRRAAARLRPRGDARTAHAAPAPRLGDHREGRRARRRRRLRHRGAAARRPPAAGPPRSASCARTASSGATR